MNGNGASEWRTWFLRLLMVVAAGLLLARLGPFDTFSDLSAVERVAYWVGLTLLMWLQGVAAFALLCASPLKRLRRSVTLVLAGLASAVPTSFEVAWAEMLLRVERDLGLLDILKIFADVCLLSVPLLLATHLVVRGSTGPEAEGSGGTGSGGTEPLLSSLKPERRGQLLALASEDHYVRIFTSAGSQLLHRRLVDAIAAAGEHNGCRVHRSWWVATGAVRSTSREGDRTIIELLDGTRVPVSRSYVLAARQAGLISA